MDPDPDPSVFIIDLQDANKKQIKQKSFSAYYFLEVLLHHFSKVKSQKEVTKQWKSRFFLLFLLNDRRIQIRSRIRIRIRIRIRNTAANSLKNTAPHISSSSFMNAWCMSVLEVL
jgi:hypothetical protein